MTMTKWMLLVVATLGAACGGSDLSPTRVVQLQVSPPIASVPAGLDQQFTAVAVFRNGHREDVTGEVSWNTRSEAIAQVDAKGLVTTAVHGTTQVSVTLGELSASADLVVSDANLVSLELVPSLVRIPLGATLAARAWGHYTDGSVIDLTSRSAWSTTTGGLDLLTAGQSRAAIKGPVRLCVRFQAMQADADLEVTDAALVAIHVASSRDLAALPRGTISTLSVSAEFTDASLVDVTGDATWESDALQVAEVVASRVRGVDQGSARLVASYLDQSASVDVTVTTAEIVGLSIFPPQATAPAGDFTALRAVATYSDGSLGDVNELVTWSSLDPEAVQVSNATNKAGHAYGMKRRAQSVVTAQLEGIGLSATTLVQVGAPTLKAIVIDQAAYNSQRLVEVGLTLQLTARAVLSDDGLDEDSEDEEEEDELHDFTTKLLWTSSSPEVAETDPAVPGLVKAIAWGNATIVATLPGNPLLQSTVQVFVRDPSN
jgi:hypothetical protein